MIWYHMWAGRRARNELNTKIFSESETSVMGRAKRNQRDSSERARTSRSRHADMWDWWSLSSPRLTHRDLKTDPTGHFDAQPSVHNNDFVICVACRRVPELSYPAGGWINYSIAVLNEVSSSIGHFVELGFADLRVLTTLHTMLMGWWLP